MRKFTAALGKMLLVLAGFMAGVYASPAPAPVDQEVRQVSVITADGQDYFSLVAGGKQLQIKSAAPLSAWVNDDIRERRMMTWCMRGLPDEPTRERARQVLSIIYGWYQGTLPGWREGCEGETYEVDDTAQDDCGIGDGAVGCAVYYGPRKVRVSFNGRMYRDRRLSLEGATGAYSHELGHAFTLDHVSCNHPKPSSMSPIPLPDGPPCASQGTNWPIREDYRDAEAMYSLPGPGQGPGPSPSPSPPPPPLPSPPPSPRWFRWPLAPLGSVERQVQDHGYNNAYCTLVDPQNSGCWE